MGGAKTGALGWVGERVLTEGLEWGGEVAMVGLAALCLRAVLLIVLYMRVLYHPVQRS